MYSSVVELLLLLLLLILFNLVLIDMYIRRLCLFIVDFGWEGRFKIFDIGAPKSFSIDDFFCPRMRPRRFGQGAE